MICVVPGESTIARVRENMASKKPPVLAICKIVLEEESSIA
jgi:hypothetical protein